MRSQHRWGYKPGWCPTSLDGTEQNRYLTKYWFQFGSIFKKDRDFDFRFDYRNITTILLQSSPEKGIDQIEVEITRWQVFLASMNSSARETLRTGDTGTMNCRLKHSIVSLHLCKEYLTAVTLETLLVLLIKCRTFWYMDHSASMKCNTLEKTKMAVTTEPVLLAIKYWTVWYV